MNAPRVTVSNVDIPAFCARYGLIQRRTGKIIDGLPETEWRPQEPVIVGGEVIVSGQTAEQARLCAEELKDGTRWKPSKL